MEAQDVLNQLVNMEIAQQQRFDILVEHLNNIESGMQIIIYVLVGFLLWQVIRIVYKLFGGIFLGV